MRLMLRLIGLVLLGAGFALAVMDGTRSIAASHVRIVRLGETVGWALDVREAALRQFVERGIHPALWDPVLTSVFQVPAAVAAALMGCLLLWAGRRPPPAIGFDGRF